MDLQAAVTIWLVGALVGSMVFFGFAVAPTVFSSLNEEQAGHFLRAFFPKYYSWGIVIALIAAAAALSMDLIVSTGCLLVALLFVFARQSLMPKINRARDDDLHGVPGARKRFQILHRWSVIINGVQMLLLVVVAFILV